MLAVRDDELDEGDNKVTVIGRCRGRDSAGRTGEVTRMGPGTTPVDGRHNAARGGTEPDFRVAGNSWTYPDIENLRNACRATGEGY
jgi:hypothetical protein